MPENRTAVTAWRGLLKRCPICGETSIFETWFELKKECPSCHFNFNREPGWWIGAMIINLAAAMLFFALILIVSAVAFWPDVPWIPIGIASMIVMAVLPIVFYPISKTIWLAVDLIMVSDPSPRR